MRITVDIDEVLADCLTAFLAYHNTRYGTQFHRGEFFSYYYDRVIPGLTRKDVVERVHDWGSEGYLQLALIPGAQEGIQALRQRGHELFAVTGRAEIFLPQTESWLDRHFPRSFQDLHLTSHFASRSGGRISKGEICSRLEARLHIDDDLEHAQGCVERSVPTLLLDSPWNQTAQLPPGVDRVYSWPEILVAVARKAGNDL